MRPVPTLECAQLKLSRKVRAARAGLALTCGLAVALALAGFAFPHQALCVDDGPRNADVIVVLGGKAPERADRAAELFLAGDAPKILVSGADDALDNRRVLVARGVPQSAILLEDQSQSTRQNAQFSLPLLRSLGARRVVVVTSWYHSRRALRCFRHYGGELEFYSRPAHAGFARGEWRSRHMWRYIRSEYVKLAGYWICYGVAPF